MKTSYQSSDTQQDRVEYTEDSSKSVPHSESIILGEDVAATLFDTFWSTRNASNGDGLTTFIA